MQLDKCWWCFLQCLMMLWHCYFKAFLREIMEEHNFFSWSKVLWKHGNVKYKWNMIFSRSLNYAHSCSFGLDFPSEVKGHVSPVLLKFFLGCLKVAKSDPSVSEAMLICMHIFLFVSTCSHTVGSVLLGVCLHLSSAMRNRATPFYDHWLLLRTVL